MFADAVENDIILKNPVTKAVKYNIGKESKKVRALTVDEQNKFIDRFSMYVLRHTMATRCIEGRMRPKTLQDMLGHSNK